MKVEIDDVGSTLSRHKTPQESQEKILADLKKAVEENKSPRQPRSKPTYILVQPNNGEGTEGVGLYLLKAPADFDLKTLESTIEEVRRDFNATKKGRKNPVKNAVETIENAKAKQWKSKKLQVLSDQPVVVIEVDNKTVEVASV